MSVFTNTQGRPAGVRALVRLLATFPEGLTLHEIESWMIPGTLRNAADEDEDSRQGRKNTSAANTLGAARSLGLVEDFESRVRLCENVSARAATDFASLVHGQFVATSQAGDRLLVALFAFMVAQSKLEGGISWLASLNTKDLVDHAEKAFKEAGPGYAEITFNKDRMPAWKDWASFVGLGFNGIPGAPELFLPEPSARLGVELPSIAQSAAADGAMSAEQFIVALSERCPYLDQGSAFDALARAVGVPEQRKVLSPILARALRELRDAKRINLEGGEDSLAALTLPADGIHKTESFDRIRVLARVLS